MRANYYIFVNSALVGGGGRKVLGCFFSAIPRIYCRSRFRCNFMLYCVTSVISVGFIVDDGNEGK